MATTPTSLPIPSEDPRDLKFNSGKIDEVVTGDAHYYTDRFGVRRFTIAGFQYTALEAIRAYGYVTLKSFQLGAPLPNNELTLPNQVLQDETNGEYYRWDGDLPKVVAPGSTPVSTGGEGPGAWVSVGDASLRSNLNEIDGASLIGGATYAQIRSYSGSATRIKCLGRNNAFDNCEGTFVLDTSDTTTPDDDGCVLVGVGGKRWKRQFSGNRSVIWFGAVQGVYAQSAADINREAFRNACLSYKDSWTAQRASGKNISVDVPAGDFIVSNGFTVPEGVRLSGAGIGATRIHCPVSVQSGPGFPLNLVILGKVIDRATYETENTDGVFLPGSAPEVENLQLSIDNRIAVEIATDTPGKDLAGWKIGNLWINASTGIIIRNTGDGIINQLVIETATAIGIRTEGNVQNIVLNSYYTFSIGYPLWLSGQTNNFNIGTMQTNYNNYHSIYVEPASVARGIKIGNFVCNQNAQPATKPEVILVDGESVAEITIGEMSVRNANGWAIRNNAQSSVFNIGTMEINQLPLNPVYTQGTELMGITTNGGSFIIGSVYASGLTTPLVTITGSNATYVQINGGIVGGSTSASLFSVTNTDVATLIRTNISNQSGKPYCDPASAWAVSYEDNLPVKQNATYKYIELPYASGGSSWEVSVVANPLPGGSSSYRVSELFVIHLDTVNDSSSVVNAVALKNISKGADPTIPGHISATADKSSVTGSGVAYLQVPLAYANVKMKVKTIHV